MIVRDMNDGQLLCIPQTSHALMAAEFVRHWGNQTFSVPRPYAAVMMAVAQHDGGWYEWEQTPRLQSNGRPMDFISYTNQQEKTQLWQRGIDRAYAQHPYAALLISRHASLLYEGFQAQDAYSGSDKEAVERFLARQEELTADVHRVLGASSEYKWCLQPHVVRANAQLLQFGDRAALQLGVPWSDEATLGPVPVDYDGATTNLQLSYDETSIVLDPWPYGRESFDVHMEGYLLGASSFETEAAYHRALAEASIYRQTWRVTPG